MPWFRHKVFASPQWETSKSQVLQEHELQGAPDGRVTGQLEITEVLRDIRQSTKKTQDHIASLERNVSVLGDKKAQFKDDIIKDSQTLWGSRTDKQQDVAPHSRDCECHHLW